MGKINVIGTAENSWSLTRLPVTLILATCSAPMGRLQEKNQVFGDIIRIHMVACLNVLIHPFIVEQVPLL